MKAKSQADIYTFTHNKLWKPCLYGMGASCSFLSRLDSLQKGQSISLNSSLSKRYLNKHLNAVMYNSHGQVYSALSLLHKEHFIKYYLNTEMKVISGGQHHITNSQT
jgi:hypothetical protein